MANDTIEDRARAQNPELKEMFDKVGRGVDQHGAGAIGSVPNPVGSTNSHGAGVTIPEQYKTPAVQAAKAAEAARAEKENAPTIPAKVAASKDTVIRAKDNIIKGKDDLLARDEARIKRDEQK